MQLAARRCSQAALVLACALACSAPALASRQLAQTGGSYPDPALADSFVQIVDGDFVLGCNKFPISGWNQWEVLEAGAGAPALTGSVLPSGEKGPQLLTSILDTAAKSGLTVMRTWAHGVTSTYDTTPKGGEDHEGLLRGLDFALAEARKRGIKVILSFGSNWTPAGGVDSYANATGVKHNDFYTSSAPKALFKSYISTVVTRTNTITGIKYSDDATIMSWNLLNEPVCRDCPDGAVNGWIKEMASYVKGLDSNHLLTVGEEGFYSTTKSSVPVNPMYGTASWAAESGQDFVADHSDPNIDYSSFHGWPDLWNCQEGCGALPLDFFKRWIDQHVKDAATLKKPVLFEEFGKKAGDRDSYYQAAYDAVEASLKSNGPLKGALFWQLYAPGQTASKGEGFGAGEFGVYESDSAFGIVKANSASTKELHAGPSAVCSKKGAPSAAVKCPAGFEGPACNIDINECARGTAGCGSGAQCVNNVGGFDCVCPIGSSGNGKSGCSNDTAALTKAMDAFWNDPKGQACDTGTNIPYPKEAAGWVEDPTGALDRDPNHKGGFGARGPVTVAQCAAACLAAKGCKEFTYNSVGQGCFLKANQCPLKNSCQGDPLICESIDDHGKPIKVACGSWTTYWSKEVHANPQQYCGANVVSNATSATVQSFGSGRR